MLSDEKRMIGDTNYEVKHSIRLGDSELIIAEDMKAPDSMFYFVGNLKDNGIIGEYSNCIVSSDYLETIQEFSNRINAQSEKVKERISNADFQAAPITIEQCYPDDYHKSIDGKLVAIRANVFLPEYRRGDFQLVLVNGGFGAAANSRGSAVYCYHLNDGSKTRFERRDVLGEVKSEYLQDWTKEKFSEIQKAITSEKKSNSRDER